MDHYSLQRSRCNVALSPRAARDQQEQGLLQSAADRYESASTSCILKEICGSQSAKVKNLWKFRAGPSIQCNITIGAESL
jgi:hypothetical protein